MLKVYSHGMLSQYMENLEIGSLVECKGHCGQSSYKGNGEFILPEATFKTSKVNMIAGGVGISPMYPIIQTIALNTVDKTKVSLISTNSSASSIPLKKEIDDLANLKAGQFKLHFPTSDKEGRISLDMLKQQLFMDKDAFTLVCGPFKFRSSVVDMLKQAGIQEDKIMLFR